jgi:hypothetical protein
MVAGFKLTTLTSILAVSGRIKERFDSVCGQIGVISITSAVGKTTAPPAASE